MAVDANDKLLKREKRSKKGIAFKQKMNSRKVFWLKKDGYDGK